MGGELFGAVFGLLLGVAMSIYVAVLDARRRSSGERTEAEYRLSLVGVPVFLALVGALLGSLIAQ